jgi:hypothetical protein
MVRRDAMELFVEPLRCSKSDDRRGRLNSQRSAHDASRYIYLIKAVVSPPHVDLPMMQP